MTTVFPVTRAAVSLELAGDSTGGHELNANITMGPIGTGRMRRDSRIYGQKWVLKDRNLTVLQDRRAPLELPR